MFRNKPIDGVLIIFSIIDRTSFGIVEEYYAGILNIRPFMLHVEAKCDLENKRVVGYKEAKDLARALSIRYIKVSAKVNSHFK